MPRKLRNECALSRVTSGTPRCLLQMTAKEKAYCMIRRVFLLAALIICSPSLIEAQSQSPITANPAAGGFQPYPPTINTPIGPPIEYNPELSATPQLAPTNELLPGEKKNVIEEAAQQLWRLILTVQGGVYYDSNIFITQNHPTSDTVFQVAAGFTFEIGDYRAKTNNYLTLKYLATGYLYTDHSDLDGVDQQFELHGQYRFDRLTAQTNISFSYLDGPDRLAGTFTTSYLIDGLFRLLYDYSDKTQLHAEFEQITDIYPSQLNSFEYIGRFGADYLITPKIKLGAEAEIGSLHLESGGESLYEQARLQAAYKYTEKLTFLGSAGVEVREYGARNLTKVTPVFDLGVNWSPFVGTTLGLSAFRRTFASPVEVGQVFEATGVQGTVSQVFFQRFTLVVSAGYENDSYQASAANAVNISRNDNYVYVRPNLSYSIGGWGTATLYYQFGRNSSSINGASFNDNRVGVQIIVAF
jgi:Putative beta-barrel porin 2